MTSNDREGNPGPGTPEDATRADWPATPPPATPPPMGPAAGPPPASPPPAGPPPGSPPSAGPAPVTPAQYPGYPSGPVAGSAPGMAWAPPPEAYGAAQAGGLRYGGTTARFLAWILDILIIGIITFVVSFVVGFFLVVVGLRSGSSAAALVSLIITIGIEALYFIGSWTSSRKATLGMRLFNLQVGNAADGADLSMGQAITRWVALGLPFQALTLAPPPLNGLVLLVSLWELVLLISTIVSPTKQGIHDKIANSAMVQPIGREGPVLPCLIALGLFILLPFVAIVALIFLGGQVSGILNTVGTSI